MVAMMSALPPKEPKFHQRTKAHLVVAKATLRVKTSPLTFVVTLSRVTPQVPPSTATDTALHDFLGTPSYARWSQSLTSNFFFFFMDFNKFLFSPLICSSNVSHELSANRSCQCGR